MVIASWSDVILSLISVYFNKLLFLCSLSPLLSFSRLFEWLFFISRGTKTPPPQSHWAQIVAPSWSPLSPSHQQKYPSWKNLVEGMQYRNKKSTCNMWHVAWLRRWSFRGLSDRYWAKKATFWCAMSSAAPNAQQTRPIRVNIDKNCILSGIHGTHAAPGADRFYLGTNENLILPERAPSKSNKGLVKVYKSRAAYLVWARF